ncbi:FAD-dependent monooxygenase [Actinomycetospora straminea]|uniref:FAD-dependent monooxygenase n=1 Tax=Actinomycetospora straminea TaxID=663607 RepID=A0ABP9DUS0_9PSEU|nr:FAD-dependent monooxygenase [Actinomycetospora straminea]MDD7935200.1 FAD-dependent monooxygenase [Actinomycetospora straminea]
MAGRALVVGAGIGGLATAIALRGAGWEVEVRERRAAPWDEGAGISLWPNALRALDALGVGDAVRAVGHAHEAGGIRDRRGRWLARTDNAVLARRHGDGILVLDRADLLRVLVDALPDGAVRTGETVDPTALGVPGETADLLVGADGIGSPTRALVAPEARPRSTGTVAWRVAAAPAGDPPRAGGETWGDGAYAGIAPHGDGRVHLWAVVPAGEPAASDLDALRHRLAGWHDPLPALLARADPASALVTELRWLPPLRRTVAGRTVLVGDAAHAMTPNLGQGACLALEDAATLGRCLASGDVDEGLRRHDRLRRPRTARLTRMSRFAGRVAGLRGRVPTAVRDGVGRLVPTAVTVRGLDGVLDWRPPA